MRFATLFVVSLAVYLSTASTDDNIVPQEDFALMQDEMADEKLTQGLFSIRWNGSSPPDTEMAEATEWQPYQYGEECFENGKWEPCDQYGKNREGWECEIKPGVWEPCVPLKHRHNPKTVKNKIEAKKNYLTSKPTFYKHCNYGGYAIGLRKSSSWVVKDGLKNDDLSSLKVPKGYTATVYQHWKYGGKKKTFGPGSYSCLVNYKMAGRTTWNDQISSIKIGKAKKAKRCGPTTRQFCPCGRVMKNGCQTSHCKKCKPGNYGGRPKPIRLDGGRGRYMEKRRKKAKQCGPTTRQFCPCGRVMKGRCPTSHCKKCKPGSNGGIPNRPHHYTKRI